MNEENNNDLHNQLFFESSSDPLPPKRKGLARSSSNYIIGGICGGIAEYLHFDASTVRLFAILSLLMGGWSMAAYLVLLLMLHVDKTIEDISPELIQKRQKENFRTVLSGFMILIGIHYGMIQIGLLSKIPFMGISSGISFSFFIIGFGLVLLVNSRIINKIPPVFPQNFTRSSNDKIISGICGGFAKYTNIDSSSLRFIFILLTGLTLGLFTIGYLVLMYTSSYDIENAGETNE